MNHRMNQIACVVALIWLAGSFGCAASDQSTIEKASAFNTGLAPAEIRDAQNNQYLQQIGDRIVAVAKQMDQQGLGPKTHFKEKDNSWMFQDLHWELVNSKTVNAFTTGGHFVYIYNALFQMCKNENELAAVMAHEYGHIYSRHVQKGSGRQQALAAATLVAAGAGYAYGGSEKGSQYSQQASALAQSGGTYFEMGYTREDEAQADDVGMMFYIRAGWPPEHFADFFKDMIAAGYDKTPASQSDHPTLASRVQKANEFIAKLDRQKFAAYLKPNIVTQDQFNQIKTAAISASASIPDDQKVLQAKNLLQALPRSCWVPDEADDQKSAQQKILDALNAKQPPPPAPAK